MVDIQKIETPEKFSNEFISKIEAHINKIYKDYQTKKIDYLIFTKDLFAGDSIKNAKQEKKYVKPKHDKSKGHKTKNSNSLKIEPYQNKENIYKAGVLKLSNSSLTEVPDYIWSLGTYDTDQYEKHKEKLLNTDKRTPLIELDLSRNVILEFIPKSCLESLKILWIEKCLLQHISDKIGIFKELRSVSFADNLLTDIPSSIGLLTCLEELYIQKNMLYKLPFSISNLLHLRRLDASCNGITIISQEVSLLKNLEVFNISHNCISVLPAELQKLSALKTMDFSYNCIMFIPDLSNMPNLQTLDSSYNNLFEFPTFKECANFTLLNLEHNRLQELIINSLIGSPIKTLRIGKNNLKFLPDDIHRLETLVELDVHNNKIKILPSRLSLIKTLHKLNVDGNAVVNVTDEALASTALTLSLLMNDLLKYETITDENLLRIRNASSQKAQCGKNAEQQFIISDQNLYTISNDVFNNYKGKTIYTVNLSKNKFSYVPNKIKMFTKTIRELVLSNNCLKILPDFLAQMENLKQLDISNNMLEDLPKTLKNNSSLEILIAANNRFKSIPPLVYTMTNIQHLNFSGNKISKIDPHKLKRLSSLLILHLSNNLIKEVPIQLLLLRGMIKRLTLFGNPVNSPDQAILEDGTEAIMAYLQHKKEMESKKK